MQANAAVAAFAIISFRTTTCIVTGEDPGNRNATEAIIGQYHQRQFRLYPGSITGGI